MKLALILFLPTFVLAQLPDAGISTLPITSAERVRWVIESTAMPANIPGAAIGAGH